MSCVDFWSQSYGHNKMTPFNYEWNAQATRDIHFIFYRLIVTVTVEKP